MDIGFMTFSKLAFGHWEGQPLYALAELGVPELLASGSKTCAALAEQLECPEDALERLLDSAVALKILSFSNGEYKNEECAQRFMTTATGETLVHWIKIMSRWKSPWIELSTAIRNGETTDDQAKWLGKDPEFMRDFILGMHEFASRSSAQFAQALKDVPVTRFIDVGGGAGTYTIALCKARAETQATILDLASVLRITEETVAKHGLSKQIDTRAIDYRVGEFGEGADAILFSNVLHQESASNCRSMLDRAKSALRQGGTLVIQGYFLNDDRRSPHFTTLHNLSALALWDGGRSWTLRDMQELILEAGFSEPEVKTRDSSGLSIIVAGKH